MLFPDETQMPQVIAVLAMLGAIGFAIVPRKGAKRWVYWGLLTLYLIGLLVWAYLFWAP